MPTDDEMEERVECPCCRGRGSSWPVTRGYECVMCAGENTITADRLPEWDHIIGSVG